MLGFGGGGESYHKYSIYMYEYIGTYFLSNKYILVKE